MDPERDEDPIDFAPRSVFSARWFRMLLGLFALALIAIIALPYLLDWFRPAPGPPVVLKPQPAPSLRPSPVETPPPASPTLIPPPRAEKPPSQAAAASVAAKPPEKVTKPASDLSEKRVKENDQAPPPSVQGGYMVQVGAFQDAANAARLAAQLAKEKYPLQRATLPRPSAGGGGHEVVVVGASVDEVTGTLKGTTHQASAIREGVLIQPALPLKEAVALSQALRADGLSVKIRRAQGTATLHIVRVGGYPERSQAEAVRKELAEKGFAGFIVEGARR